MSGVLTTCHTQYTWDSSICIFFLFNRTTLKVFVTYLRGALYFHPLWFYKHQHDNRVRSTQNAFSLPFAAILVNCAPSGKKHNYCIPHIIKENWEFLKSIPANTYSYLTCIVYDKLLKPRQLFWITLYNSKCRLLNVEQHNERRPWIEKNGKKLVVVYSNLVPPPPTLRYWVKPWLSRSTWFHLTFASPCIIIRFK